jgi:hypothetical protein
LVPDTVVMRVRCIYGSNLIADPCNDYFGEVEDYSMVLRDALMAGMQDAMAGDLVLIPNPAKDAVTISWVIEDLGPATVKLIDLQGRSLRQVLPTMASTCNLDLKGLAQGIYIVEVQQGGSIKRQRLQITK